MSTLRAEGEIIPRHMKSVTIRKRRIFPPCRTHSEWGRNTDKVSQSMLLCSYVHVLHQFGVWAVLCDSGAFQVHRMEFWAPTPEKMVRELIFYRHHDCGCQGFSWWTKWEVIKVKEVENVHCSKISAYGGGTNDSSLLVVSGSKCQGFLGIVETPSQKRSQGTLSYWKKRLFPCTKRMKLVDHHTEHHPPPHQKQKQQQQQNDSTT